MSRMMKRKNQKKVKRQIGAGMLMILILLLTGLLVVDGAHREMMAAYEEKPVLGYQLQGEDLTLYFVGKDLTLNQHEISEAIAYLFGSAKNLLNRIKLGFQNAF